MALTVFSMGTVGSGLRYFLDIEMKMVRGLDPPMEIVKVDIIHPESLQRFVNGLSNILGVAIDSSVVLEIHPKFGCKENFVSFAGTSEPREFVRIPR